MELCKIGTELSLAGCSQMIWCLTRHVRLQEKKMVEDVSLIASN